MPLRGRPLFTLRFLWHANRARLPYRFIIADGQVRPRLAAILDKIFAAQPLAHWRDAFERARVTYGIVKTAAEVTSDPQVIANDIIVPIEGGGEHLTRTVSSPIKIHGVPKAAARRGPELGEHNEEVLRELGFSADQIEGFRASATIPQANHDREAVGGKR